MLSNFFAQLNPADFIVHEIFCPQRHTPLPVPCAVISRFKDNVPMALVHFPADVKDTMLQVLSAFLRGLYQIGLKWEEHGSVEQLCECDIDTRSPIFLQRKGIVLSVEGSLRPDFDWQRWLPVSSPCNYEANPRYCTFANSWSTPCREHSTCLYSCTVLLLRFVHET